MKVYALSLSIGVLVGVIYGVLNVRSPAPPIIALLGLFGILSGEQIPPLVKRLFTNEPAAHAWFEQIKPHMFGRLPSGSLTTEAHAVERNPGEKVHS
jgi:XapX domain-containing protein